MEQLPVLHSKEQRYYGFLADFASGFNRQHIVADPLLDDMAVGKRLSRSLNRKRLLTDQQIVMAYDSIANDKVRQLLPALHTAL